MRPSSPSSSDPNAPYRATTPVFIDFFAKEAAEEQQVRGNANRPHSPFAELSPRGVSTSNRSDAAMDAGTSSASPVTVSSLRSFLRSKGNRVGEHMHEFTIQNRLDRGNLSAETLLAALEIVYTPDHPLLRELGVSVPEHFGLVRKLTGIVNYTVGFNSALEAVAQRSNNNPHQLIANVLQLVR